MVTDPADSHGGTTAGERSPPVRVRLLFGQIGNVFHKKSIQLRVASATIDENVFQF